MPTREGAAHAKCRWQSSSISKSAYFAYSGSQNWLTSNVGQASAQCHLHCDKKCGRTGASPSMTLEVCSIRTGRETRLVWGCVGENRKRWAFFIQGAAKRSGIGFECGD